jgi:hypothetical protein
MALSEDENMPQFYSIGLRKQFLAACKRDTRGVSSQLYISHIQTQITKANEFKILSLSFVSDLP